MSCDISLGRNEPCKDVVGGLDAIYFINFADAPYTDLAFDATNTDVIETINGTPSTVSAYKYELKADENTFEETITSDRNTGTTFFEGVLNVSLKKMDLATHKEVKLLAFGRPHIVLKDRNNNFFYMGAQWGCELTGGTIATGGAMGDKSGYMLTFTSRETIPTPFMEATTEAALAAAGLSVVTA
jgi:hypothetical protein